MQISKTALLAVVALFIAISAIQPAAAQVLYGSIVGQVEDPSGSVVPAATVVATNTLTGATRETKTDEQGRYSIPNVPAGRYDLKIMANGFRPATQSNLEITVNTVMRQDVRLEVGATTEAVTVLANAVQLQTDKSDVRSEISSTAVTSLPLPGYRNYQSLINLVPGSTPAGFQNAVVDTPGRALTTNINGTARNNNNTLVDGAVSINIWLPHHTAYVAPVESIDNVNITTGSMDAEQGMAGGAAITVTTKSGTNEIHGSGFWFHKQPAPDFGSVLQDLHLRKAAEHLQPGRRLHRRADQEGQAVLLLQLRKDLGADRELRQLLRRSAGLSQWGFQQLDQLLPRV